MDSLAFLKTGAPAMPPALLAALSAAAFAHPT